MLYLINNLGETDCTNPFLNKYTYVLLQHFVSSCELKLKYLSVEAYSRLSMPLSNAHICAFYIPNSPPKLGEDLSIASAFQNLHS
jgi:hypothetical protein